MESGSLFTNTSCEGLVYDPRDQTQYPKRVPMDIMGFIMGSLWLLIALFALVAAIIGGIFYKIRYKTADADKALVNAIKGNTPAIAETGAGPEPAHL